MVADDAAQTEGGGHCSEGRVRRADAEQGETSETSSVNESLLQLVVEVVGWWRGFLGDSCERKEVIINVLQPFYLLISCYSLLFQTQVDPTLFTKLIV